jgi:endonuclease-3
MQSVKTNEIMNYFRSLFGDTPKCELNFKTDIECLVAIILSAQCTDKRVNIVTKPLFQKYKTVFDYANADLGDFERTIYSTGFYRNKAKNIIQMAREVVEKHDGKIPTDFHELTNLSGVGRKTAGVYTVEFLHNPAFPVDTHVTRVSRRLGLAKALKPHAIESELKTVFEKPDWARAHLYMVLFGRYFCTAKNPKCENCVFRGRCDA